MHGRWTKRGAVVKNTGRRRGAPREKDSRELIGKRMGKRLGKSEGQVQGRSQIFTPAFDGRQMCDTGHKNAGRRKGAPRKGVRES